MIFVYYLFGYDDNFDSPVYASLNKFEVVLLVHCCLLSVWIERLSSLFLSFDNEQQKTLSNLY